MTCQKCGREAERGRATHWLGCEAITPQHFEAGQVALDPVVICEFEGCDNKKKEWSGRGAKPKYCADGHK